MMRWGLVALLALTGCDYVLGLRSFPDGAPGDADTADAPAPHPCAGRSPPPLFCADFDDSTPTVYTDGVPSTLALDATDAVVELRSPSTTGRRALWITSHGGTFTKVVMGSTAFAVITATFDFQIATSTTNPTSDTGLMRLAGQNPPALSSCYANFVLDETVPTLRLNGACGDAPNTDFLTGNLPSQWIHVQFWIDFKVAAAYIQINSGSMIVQPFAGAPGALVPLLQIGIDGPGHDGLVVGYDDITIEGSG